MPIVVQNLHVEGYTPICWFVTLCSCTDKETTKAEASLLTHVIRSNLVVSEHDVEVQRDDPNSPLYSVKSFEELHL